MMSKQRSREGLGLMHHFQYSLLPIAKNTMSILSNKDEATLSGCANQSMLDVRNALTRGDAWLASRLMLVAAFSVYQSAARGNSEHCNAFEEMVLEYPSPLTILPTHFVSSELGMLLFWQRCERFIEEEDLSSANPNRVEFSRLMIQKLAAVEKESGVKGNPLRLLASQLNSPTELKESWRSICPEKHIDPKNVLNFISTLCGVLITDWTKADFKNICGEITFRTMATISCMSFLELRDLFANEKGAMAEGVAPFKISWNSTILEVKSLHTSGKITLNQAASTVDKILMVAQLYKQAMISSRDLPQDFIVLKNPFRE